MTEDAAEWILTCAMTDRDDTMMLQPPGRCIATGQRSASPGIVMGD